VIAAIYARGFWPAVYVAATIGFMAVIGALVKYGSRNLSDAIYLVTGIVLLAYTIETWRLRREAQLQTELQNRPFASLTAQRFEPAVHVVNIGKGLARNIELAEVAVGSTFRITAPPSRTSAQARWTSRDCGLPSRPVPRIRSPI
jgi:hypothetical protein